MRVPTRQKLQLSTIPAVLLGFALFSPLLIAQTAPSTNAGSPISDAEAEEIVSATDSAILHDVILQLLPEDRHYREQLAGALASVYNGRGFRPLWPDIVLLDSLHREICTALNSHALPELMALDPTRLLVGIETDIVDKRDLAVSVAILDAALMIRLGYVPTESIWDQWNAGDTPGDDARDVESIAKDLIVAASLTPFKISRVTDELGPKNWIYRELRKAYPEAKKSILTYDGLPAIPDPATTGIGKPGAAYPSAPAVGAHLADRGYLHLPEEQVAALSRITPELELALRAFQGDHGLDPDGVFGPASWLYLNTNAASHFRSIVINLHRARLLPEDLGDRYLLVNLPTAELYGFEDNNFHTTTMRVVHGKAEKEAQQTPIFRDVMKEVVFGPYWNVPPSIAKNEILPKALGDRAFLSRYRYEIVSDFNPYKTGTHRPSPRNLELVAEGRLYFRQLPGPTNALGRVKFLFPNANNIYMHDTPAKHFFARSKRDHSHGCIRVASPDELGAWVLGTQGWSREEVKEAMFAGSRRSETVQDNINVFIVYFTTFPRPVSGGKIVLAPGRDVYELDPKDAKTLTGIIPWVEPASSTGPLGDQ
jgi:murein L,D-transpeptidase YcbB/YkuD